jgi:hypothetical protein
MKPNYKKVVSEIENAMERWHHARDNDNETLEDINNILVEIGLLDWFNKNKISDTETKKSFYGDDITVYFKNGQYVAEMVDDHENESWYLHFWAIEFIETLPKLFQIYEKTDLKNEFDDKYFTYKQAEKKISEFEDKKNYIIKEVNCYDLYDFIYFQGVIDAKKRIII